MLPRSVDYDTEHHDSKYAGYKKHNGTHYNGTAHHGKKKNYHKVAGQKADDTPKFCFEGHTYDDTGVSAWVRRCTPPVFHY
jgi:hypothetical protein